MNCKKGIVCLVQSPGNGTRKGKKYKSSSSFQGILPQQHTGATNPSPAITVYFDQQAGSEWV